MEKIKQWLKAIWYKSWTNLLGQIKVIGGLLLAIVSYVGHLVNDPSVHDALLKFNLSAEIGLGIAVLGALVLISEAHNA